MAAVEDRFGRLEGLPFREAALISLSSDEALGENNGVHPPSGPVSSSPQLPRKSRWFSKKNIPVIRIEEDSRFSQLNPPAEYPVSSSIK
jgi:hypothetical protein